MFLIYEKVPRTESLKLLVEALSGTHTANATAESPCFLNIQNTPYMYFVSVGTKLVVIEEELYIDERGGVNNC